MKFIRRTIESLEQVFFWFPIIWKTRDFDYSYLLEMLELKMKRMLKFFTSKDCMSEQKEEDLLALKRCIEIINIIYNETYNDVAFEKHYKEYPMKSQEEMFEDSPKYDGFKIMKPLTDEESKSFGKANKLSEKIHKELLDEFGKLFGTHYNAWWD